MFLRGVSKTVVFQIIGPMGLSEVLENMSRLRKHCFAALLSVWLCLVLGLSVGSTRGALAAEGDDPASPELQENMTVEQIDALLAGMSDDQVRRLLLDQLKESARKELEGEQGSATERFRASIDRLGRRMDDMFSVGVKKLIPDMATVYKGVAGGGGFGAFLLVLVKTGFLIMVGLLLELAVRRRRDRLFTSPRGETDSSVSSLRIAFQQALLSFMDVIVFFLGAIIAYQVLYRGGGSGSVFAYYAGAAIVVIRIFILLFKLVFTPDDPGKRWAGLNNEDAQLAYRWAVIGVSAAVVLGYFSAICRGYGVSEETLLIVRSLAVLMIPSALAIMTLMHLSRGLKAIKDHADDVARSGRIWIYHFLFLLYLVLGWIISQGSLLLQGQAMMLRFVFSFLAIPLFMFMDRLAIGVLRQMTGNDAKAAEADSEPETETRGPVINPVEASAIRGIRVFLVLGIALALIHFWGIDLPWSLAVSRAVFSIFVTLLLAFMAWQYIKSTIEKKLERQSAEARESEDGPVASLPRLFTLLPLLEKTIGVVIFVTVGLIVLAALGVDIGPLLASAGVFGLAIGLGAQTVVKDIVAGIFFLMDDAFRVGDYVQMDSVEGFVEKISLRTVTMRHYKGQVQVLPYGDIKSVTNYSRGPMLVKFELFLPADTDFKQVKKIIKGVNADLMADEEYGSKLVEDVKCQGIKSITDGVMTVKVKFRAKSGTQFDIRREAFLRIHKALKKKGIHFASRGVAIIPPQNQPGYQPVQGDGPAETPAAPSSGEPAPPLDMSTAAAAASMLLDDSGGKKKK